MALEKEIETYRRRLPELLAHKGQYVVIRGDEVAGFAADLDAAERLGYERYGLKCPFLIKRVEAQERLIYTNRPIIPCRSSPEK